jgi:dipeptidyl aminopeptidase/acylaminoacyl peptidase
MGAREVPFRANGVPVEYVVLPDERHGFTKGRHRIEGPGKVPGFLDR